MSQSFVSKNSPRQGSYSPTPKINDTGTQIQARAWALANPSVVKYIILVVSMSEHRQEFLDLKLRYRLSVADAIILHQRVGVTKAANFVVAAVDPWRFPHDDAPATFNVRCQVQSVVAKATFLGRILSDFTDTTISAFLLSLLLVKKGDRPHLVLKPKSERSKSSSKAVGTAAATFARKPSSQPSIFQYLRYTPSEVTPSPPHHTPITRVLIIVVLLDAYM